MTTAMSPTPSLRFFGICSCSTPAPGPVLADQSNATWAICARSQAVRRSRAGTADSIKMLTFSIFKPRDGMCQATRVRLINGLSATFPLGESRLSFLSNRSRPAKNWDLKNTYRLCPHLGYVCMREKCVAVRAVARPNNGCMVEDERTNLRRSSHWAMKVAKDIIFMSSNLRNCSCF
jgi:hypothetical protein